MSDLANNRLYKSIILEIRPRLRSVNVLVSFTCPVEGVKVTLAGDGFKIDGNMLNMTVPCKNFKIVENSLSSLHITETCISFRFATEGSLEDWGSFKTELLKTTKSFSSIKPAKTFLEKSITYNIQCKNCLQDLSEPVQFERVLPLPSENSEPSDWFCHGHQSSSLVLDPKESDIFYTQCYCNLNKKYTKNMLQSNKVIVCKRCFSWIGLVKNSDTVKFWFNTVNFTDKTTAYTSSPLKDVFSVLQEVLSNILFNTAKVLLFCQSSKNKNDYLLVWVLEKQLNVHIYDSCGVVQDCKVAKVLFKYQEDCNDSVKSWEQDPSVTSIDISKPMIIEILKHLYKFNKIFPKEFSESNNFYISYLMMYEHDQDK